MKQADVCKKTVEMIDGNTEAIEALVEGNRVILRADVSNICTSPATVC